MYSLGKNREIRLRVFWAANLRGADKDTAFRLWWKRGESASSREVARWTRSRGHELGC